MLLKYPLCVQSPELTEFYSSVHRYLTQGIEPSNGRFLRNQTCLCGMLMAYMGGSAGHPESSSLYFEMKRQFKAAGLCITFPFNEGNHLHFWDEKTRQATWQNQARLAWIHDHLQGL
ncbi:hypothetical protein [Roseococcus sp.]|uniref:hypothetical protein n=1 Tax=Roseococcus sp. TaxID=2109646 RepID=UPI003BA9C231